MARVNRDAIDCGTFLTRSSNTAVTSWICVMGSALFIVQWHETRIGVHLARAHVVAIHELVDFDGNRLKLLDRPRKKLFHLAGTVSGVAMCLPSGLM